MKKEIKKYIKSWEKRCYQKGIPDEIPLAIERKTNHPSYRRIAISILKNDPSLKHLGKSPKKTQIYYDLKRKELIESGKLKQIQTKLF